MSEDIDLQIAAFFHERNGARLLFDKVRSGLGCTHIRVSKSQITFESGRPFAWAWTPDRWLAGGHTAPLVLSIALSHRDLSPRWKQVVEPRPGRWIHHLEVWSPDDVDDEVRAWLAEAEIETHGSETKSQRTP